MAQLGVVLRGLALLLMAGLITVAWAQNSAEDIARTLPSSNFNAVDDAPDHGIGDRHLFAAPGFAAAPLPRNNQHPDARRLGDASCRACHALESEHFAHTVHALGMEAAKAADPNTPVCEACHGPGSVHAQQPTLAGSIIGFSHGAGTPLADQQNACLTDRKSVV